MSKAMKCDNKKCYDCNNNRCRGIQVKANSVEEAIKNFREKVDPKYADPNVEIIKVTQGGGGKWFTLHFEANK